MQTENSTTKNCPSCSALNKVTARFCSECGKKFSAPREYGFKAYASTFVLAATLFGFGWYGQATLAGKKPKEAPDQTNATAGHGTENPHAGSATRGNVESPHGQGDSEKLSKEDEEAINEALARFNNDPEIQKLREEAKTKKDKASYQALSAGLMTKMEALNMAPPAIVFEVIDSLRAILDIDPKDPSALLTMADLSFNQQAFTKAAEYYKSYLEVNPDDADSRARYASSLTFLGRYDESVKELNKALETSPENFHALAYLSITYAQMGKKEEALGLGDRVLKVAPNAEARDRFNSFLESLKGQHGSDGANPHAANGPATEDAKSASAGAPAGVDQVVEHIKANQVAGRKFVRAESPSEEELHLYFQEFPMDQMPPFIRDKFLNGIKDKAKASAPALKTVKLLDAADKKELSAIDLTK